MPLKLVVAMAIVTLSGSMSLAGKAANSDDRAVCPPLIAGEEVFITGRTDILAKAENLFSKEIKHKVLVDNLKGDIASGDDQVLYGFYYGADPKARSVKAVEKIFMAKANGCFKGLCTGDSVILRDKYEASIIGVNRCLGTFWVMLNRVIGEVMTYDQLTLVAPNPTYDEQFRKDTYK